MQTRPLSVDAMRNLPTAGETATVTRNLTATLIRDEDRLFVISTLKLADDFVGGWWALRRVIRHRAPDDVRAVRAELRYLLRVARRADRRLERKAA